jgi:hypothetical protein
MFEAFGRHTATSSQSCLFSLVCGADRHKIMETQPKKRSIAFVPKYTSKSHYGRLTARVVDMPLAKKPAAIYNPTFLLYEVIRTSKQETRRISENQQAPD